MNRGNGAGVALTIGGAALMALAAFLPLFEPTGIYRTISENSLIQHGGWLFLVAAIGSGTAGLRSYYSAAQWWLPLVGAAAGALILILWGSETANRTLYPIGLNGQADTSSGGTVANFGMAIYVAGLGIALVAAGAVVSKQMETSATSGGRKKCPDCAETVLADAQVCKHCGYRFPAEDHPPEPQEVKPKLVRCNGCGAIEHVFADDYDPVCTSCHAPLVQKTVHCEGCHAEQKVPVTANKYFICRSCQQPSRL